MKKLYFIIAVLCIASLFASCIQDQTPVIPAFGDEVEVEMNITATTLSNTRATHTDESNIADLSVLVFDAKDAANEDDAIFLYYRHAWLKVVDNKNTYRTTLKTGNDLKIYLAANVKDLIMKEGLLAEGMTYAQVRELLILESDSDPKGPKKLVKDKLPMWGIIKNKVNIRESDEFVDLGKVLLLRSVASTDIVITDTNFEFTGAYIVCATDKGYLTHKADNVTESTDDIKIIEPKVPSGSIYNFGNTAADRWYHPATTIGAGIKGVVNTFYMYENDATAATAPGKNYTKLIVFGKYNNIEYYYPLAFRNKDREKVQVARNRKFEITVIKVNGPGFSEIDEAINSEDASMIYEVIVWDDGYRDSDVIIDGTNYVSFLGGKTILLANEEDSDALRWFSTNALQWDGDTPSNLEWTFEDNFDDESEVSKENEISNDRFKVELKKDATASSGESYYFEVTALADYTSTDEGAHVAILTIKFGRIQFRITLQQVENGWGDGGNQDENL